MDSNLKPCPFCGGIPVTGIEVTSWSGNRATIELSVKCSSCGISKRRIVELNREVIHADFSYFVNTMYAVMDDWNSRYTGTSPITPRSFLDDLVIDETFNDLNDII